MSRHDLRWRGGWPVRKYPAPSNMLPTQQQHMEAKLRSRFRKEVMAMRSKAKAWHTSSARRRGVQLNQLSLCALWFALLVLGDDLAFASLVRCAPIQAMASGSIIFGTARARWRACRSRGHVAVWLGSTGLRICRRRLADLQAV